MIPIASPLATEKDLICINKLIESSEFQVTGIKACQREILKSSKGILVLTGNTDPMDLITHLPALCEENEVKYIFVRSKNDLCKDVTCVFIGKNNIEEYKNLSDSIKSI